MILVSVVLVAQALVNLANKVQVAVSGGLVSVLPIVLPRTTITLSLVLICWASLPAFALVCLESEALDGGKWVFSTTLDEVFVP